MNIESIIREYLLRSDQLVFPGFGTFRVLHQPAQINRETKLLLPPSKNIVFDSQQRSGDNQFMLFVKKKLCLTESEADEIIKQFLDKLEEDLRNTGKAVIEEVGEFSLDRDGKLKFESLGNLLNLTGVFALPEIHIPAFSRPENVVVASADRIVPEMPVRRARKNWKVPATILGIILVLIMLVYFTGFFDHFPGNPQIKKTIKKEEANKQNRMVFGSRKSSVQDTLQDNVSRQLDERTKKENALRPEEKKQKNTAEPSLSVPVPEISSAGPYHIISGAFLALENAEKLQKQLRQNSFNAVVLPRKGKYFMVSLGSYPTRKQAANGIKKLQENLDQELWVMKVGED